MSAVISVASRKCDPAAVARPAVFSPFIPAAIELEPMRSAMPPNEPKEKEWSGGVEAIEERLARARRRLNESAPSSPAWEAVHAEIEQLEAILHSMDHDPRANPDDPA
jgi:hypothetical protein